MKQCFTPQQVAAMLQLDLPYIHGMIRKKELRAFDILPGIIRITSDSVDEFIRKRSVQGMNVYQMPQEFRKLSHRAQNVLYRLAMFNSVEELTQYTRNEWMKFRGVGSKTIDEIERLCQAHGFELAQES
jgi:DNA-directed RNA polymerase alpha subunit